MIEKHKIDDEAKLEQFEAQSEIDNGKINELKIQVSQHEYMAKKANKLFTKRMKEENRLRTNAEKDILDKQEMINELES